MPSHYFYMKQAIALAEEARYHAPPNPWVGCVIVKENRIIGRGFTQPPGQAHAEIGALHQAGERVQGATLYATLEPCSHTGRTPPCTQAIIRAGIRKVIFGIKDPDIRVSGNGRRQLEQAGIEVIEGLGKEEIECSLAPYLYQRQTCLPFTLLKVALSLDGCLAANDRSSQWITCPEARLDAHHYRASSQAILIGSGTALNDTPRLTVRHPDHQLNRPPLRVLLDSSGRVPAQGPLFDAQEAPTLVVTTSEGANRKQKEWEAAGAEVVIVSSSLKGVDLQETWQLLGKRMILQVLVEGGSALSTALLDMHLVNRLIVYMGPLLLGSTGISFFQKQIATLADAKTLSLQDVQKIGECVRMNYHLK